MNNYDLQDVKVMAGDDEDFLKIVVQTFLEEIPPDVEAMNNAISNGNSSLAYQYAHKMKPNLQMFGLNLMDQILIIEDWSKKGTGIEGVQEAATVISEKVARASESLKSDFSL